MSFQARLSKEWVSPIYVFFTPIPCIEHVNHRHVHIFQCAMVQCKGKHGRDMHRFLDTGNARSTSGLWRHAKMCWGDETVNAADRTKDLSAARTILVSGLKRSGSITAAFERIRKSSITYSHRQLTYTETRYDLTLPSECESHLTCTQGRDCEVGRREQAALCDCRGPPIHTLDEDQASRVSFAIGSNRC